MQIHGSDLDTATDKCPVATTKMSSTSETNSSSSNRIKPMTGSRKREEAAAVAAQEEEKLTRTGSASLESCGTWLNCGRTKRDEKREEAMASTRSWITLGQYAMVGSTTGTTYPFPPTLLERFVSVASEYGEDFDGDVTRRIRERMEEEDYSVASTNTQDDLEKLLLVLSEGTRQNASKAAANDVGRRLNQLENKLAGTKKHIVKIDTTADRSVVEGVEVVVEPAVSVSSAG